MEAIAEYPTRWEANVALARLSEAGYEGAVLVDPATDIAPHHVTDRVAVLVVRAEAAESAAELLGLERTDTEAERLDAAFHRQRFADRPAWVRYVTWTLMIAIPGPFAISGLWLLWDAAAKPVSMSSTPGTSAPMEPVLARRASPAPDPVASPGTGSRRPHLGVC